MNDDFYRPPHVLDASIESGGFEMSTVADSLIVQGEARSRGNSAGVGSVEASLAGHKVSKKQSDAEKLLKVVRRIEILNAVFDTMSGKDRIAKISKYVIDLLRMFIQRSTHRNNIAVDLDSYAKVFSNSNIFTVLRNPKLSAQLLVASSSKLFLEKGALVSNQLGFYRQIMRCGGTPFRLHNWYHKFLTTFHTSRASPTLHSKSMVWYKHWWNEDTLSEFIDLYYGIMDELMLLHKLKLWSNKSMYDWVGRHEALSWYYDIMLGLKKNWEKLQSIRQKEFELKVQYQVRQRALELSSKLNATSSLENNKNASLIKQTIFESFKQDNIDLEQEMIQKVKKYQYDKRIVKFDLSRLFFDFLADSTDVFSIKTPPGTYAILSLCSGILGFSKLWVQAEETLRE
ncbi:unnamed protein product [Kluyveromyces dobzhanskii CBS 2104]|uniref:WGS project CCBQ000000000 data, contig 00272 n=1 Tax=Kluyveromyces dobzhanskii CBS 2104 TaxID=1427455 RepID=A0A0A8LAY6_9SACH|nr:unnamed protein product [Kluyveromyces dobzhanskii CBS 2104]